MKKFISIFLLTSFFVIISGTIFFTVNVKIENIYAHEELKIGNLTITSGWKVEPPLVNQLNNLILDIKNEENQPIRNALTATDISISYGGLTKTLNFQPSEESAGLYEAEIIPTELGTYSLTIKGKIENENIDNVMKVEDVEDLTKLTFPVSAALQDRQASQTNKQINQIASDLNNQLEDTEIKAENALNTSKEVLKTINEINDSINKNFAYTLIAIGIGSAGIIIAAMSLRAVKT